MAWDITELTVTIQKKLGDDLFAFVSIPCPMKDCGGTIESACVLVAHLGEDNALIKPSQDLHASDLWPHEDPTAVTYKLSCDTCKSTLLLPPEEAGVLTFKLAHAFLATVENLVALHVWAEKRRAEQGVAVGTKA